MSSQSGIAANQHLLDEFKSYVSSSARFFAIKIADEQLVAQPLPETAASSSSSLAQDLDSLHTSLSPSEPLFLIVRKDSPAASFVFISYVPDNARVHDKMVYASTKNTVLRNLGSEHFQQTLFVNDADELSKEGWNQIEHSESSPGPLTESEKSLQKVRTDELLQVAGTQKQSLARDESGGLSFGLQPQLQSVLYDSGAQIEGKLLSIVIEGESLSLAGEKSVSSPKSELVSSLSTEGPSYNLLGYKGDTYFLYCCPSGSKVRDRMKYAANKLAFTKALQSHGYKFKEVIEVGDPDEIELSVFGPQAAAQQPAKTLRFAKPRGPRRR